MKNLIIILSLLLGILYGCSSAEEKKEEVREEPIVKKKEIVKEKKPLEVNYEKLKKITESNWYLPVEYLDTVNTGFPTKVNLFVKSRKLGERSDFIIASISTSLGKYIGLFSKKTGYLTSFLTYNESNEKDTIFCNSSIVPLSGNYEKFMIVSDTLERAFKNDGSASVSKSIGYSSLVIEIRQNAIIPLDTLPISINELLDSIKVNASIPKQYFSSFDENNKWLSDSNNYKLDFGLRRINDSNISLGILTDSKDSGMNSNLLFLVTIVENNGLILSSAKLDLKGINTNTVHFLNDGDENDVLMTFSDELGKENVVDMSESSTGKKRYSISIDQNGYLRGINKLSTLSFLDFIERFKNNRQTVSMYKDEEYYASFMEIGYGGLESFEHLASTDRMQVFRVSWSVYEDVTEYIWVFDNDGNFKSDCQVEYPGGAFFVTVDEFSFDKKSDIPLEFEIYAAWREFEVIEPDGGMPEITDKYEEDEGKWILRIGEDYKCSFKEVEL